MSNEGGFISLGTATTPLCCGFEFAEYNCHVTCILHFTGFPVTAMYTLLLYIEVLVNLWLWSSMLHWVFLSDHIFAHQCTCVVCSQL